MWEEDICSITIRWMERVSPTIGQLKEKAIQALKKEGYPAGDYQIYSLIGDEIVANFAYEVK